MTRPKPEQEAIASVTHKRVGAHLEAVRALLGRKMPPAVQTHLDAIEALSTAYGEGLIDNPGVAMGLPFAQAQIFALLFRHEGRVVHQGMIFEALYGDDPNGGPDIAVIQVFISYLRKRIAPDWEIKTFWKSGYMLTRTALVLRVA